jgi:hypothetical protein
VQPTNESSIHNTCNLITHGQTEDNNDDTNIHLNNDDYFVFDTYNVEELFNFS